MTAKKKNTRLFLDDPVVALVGGSDPYSPLPKLMFTPRRGVIVKVWKHKSWKGFRYDVYLDSGRTLKSFSRRELILIK